MPNHHDGDFCGWIVQWLAADVADFDCCVYSPADALQALTDAWWELRRGAAESDSLAITDGMFCDLLAVSLVRLQAIIGSLGADLDEQILNHLSHE